MNIDDHFDIYVISIELTCDYYNKPFSRYTFIDCNKFISFSHFDPHLIPWKVSYMGNEFKSWIYPKDSKEIWQITSVNFDTLVSFKSDLHGAWDDRKMQPFFFRHYENDFGKFESIFDDIHGWYDFRPTLIYVKPKNKKGVAPEIRAEAMEEVVKKLVTHPATFFSFRHFDTISTGLKNEYEKGCALILYQVEIFKENAVLTDGDFFCDTGFLNYAKWMRDDALMEYYKYKWHNFCHPDFSSFDTNEGDRRHFGYADNINSQLLEAYKTYYRLYDDSMSAIGSAKESGIKFKRYLESSLPETLEKYDARYLPSIIISDYEQADFISSIIQMKKERLDKVAEFNQDFYASAATRTNLSLQRKVYFLSWFVFILTLATILLGSLTKDTILTKFLSAVGIEIISPPPVDKSIVKSSVDSLQKKVTINNNSGAIGKIDTLRKAK